MTRSIESLRNSKYEALRAIGSGGMGEVYLGIDHHLERHVAIKLLRGDLQYLDWKNHLAREAKLLAKLNHPNIVQIFDVIQLDGTTAIVMEYVEGNSLQRVLREGQPDLMKLLRWLVEIANALSAAHSAGIAHNDLKIENVLIGADGVAKISDFGIASTNSNFDTDMQAFGRLAQRILEDQIDKPPDLQSLIKQLTRKTSYNRPNAQETAKRLEIAWQFPVQLTQIPDSKSGRPITSRFGLAALVFTAIASMLTLDFLLEKPLPFSHVAVLPTEVVNGEKLTPQQKLNLRSTVQQALQQSVLTTEQLALISAGEVAKARGGLEEISNILGADELIASKLDCTNANCDLTIERMGGLQKRVIASRTTSIVIESNLESYSIVQRQWAHLYPNADSKTYAQNLVTESVFQAYLALYQAAYIGSGNQKSTLADLEELLREAGSFLPIYDLYTHSSLEMFDETGDPQYLDRLEAALDQAEFWAGSSLLHRRNKFRLAIQRKNYKSAAIEIDRISELGGNEVLINKLSGDLHSYQFEHEKAHKYYSKALGKKPSRALHYSVAFNYYEWGKLEAAKETLATLLELYPNDMDAHGLLGWIYLEKGLLDQAIVELEHSLDIQSNVLYSNNLGLAYMLRGEYARSRDQFLKIYESGNRHPSVVLNLADAEQLIGNSEAADFFYESIVTGNTEEYFATKPGVLSQAYAQLGKFEEAIVVLKEIEQDGIKYSEAAFDAALVYSLANQRIAALVEVRRALKSNYGAIWFSLPWFDGLCSEPGFSILMKNSGYSGRCRSAIESGI